MTILGIGADIVQIRRILDVLRRRGPEKLARRILSPAEHLDWQNTRLAERDASSQLSHDAQFLGVRWALKEAGYKALYPLFRPTWKELVYHPLGAREPGSKPSLTYNSDAGLVLHCSVSHDGDYVFATVVAEK